MMINFFDQTCYVVIKTFWRTEVLSFRSNSLSSLLIKFKETSEIIRKSSALKLCEVKIDPIPNNCQRKNYHNYHKKFS